MREVSQQALDQMKMCEDLGLPYPHKDALIALDNINKVRGPGGLLNWDQKKALIEFIRRKRNWSSPILDEELYDQKNETIYLTVPYLERMIREKIREEKAHSWS